MGGIVDVGHTKLQQGDDVSNFTFRVEYHIA